MKGMLLLLAVLIGWAGSLSGEEEEGVRRYLYMATPDGAQKDTASGTGVLIFDIDEGYEFVRRIEVPGMEGGVRGFTGSTATKCAYFGTTLKRMGCLNLETDEVVWEREYSAGCDRSCITQDGKTVYAPTGWWTAGEESGFVVIDAETGEEKERMYVNDKAHNSIASLDGKFVYLGTLTTLTQFDARDGSVVQTVAPVGEKGVFPYTVDSRNEYAYVCLGGHAGFDVVDLWTGEVPHRVFALDEKGERVTNRTHGAGMTPDETELWISDQKGKRLFTFDLTQMPPAQTGQVALSTGGHGWVCFSKDGKYAWCHTPDVFDVATRERVAELRDEKGEPFSSSKFIEVHFRGDEVVWVGNEFGLGRVELTTDLR
jgi:outer membrane protein assembly factor BamB